LWGLTIPPGVLAIADEAIEYRYFLLQRIRSLLARSGGLLVDGATVAFGGEADMPRPPLVYRSVEFDPKRTLGVIQNNSGLPQGPAGASGAS
jgi:hypothetical protein